MIFYYNYKPNYNFSLIFTLRGTKQDEFLTLLMINHNFLDKLLTFTYKIIFPFKISMVFMKFLILIIKL